MTEPLTKDETDQYWGGGVGTRWRWCTFHGRAEVLRRNTVDVSDTLIEWVGEALEKAASWPLTTIKYSKASGGPVEPERMCEARFGYHSPYEDDVSFHVEGWTGPSNKETTNLRDSLEERKRAQRAHEEAEVERLRKQRPDLFEG